MKFIVFALFLLCAPAFSADRFENLSAQQIFVKDMTSGQVLYAKNADQQMPTSSMSKVMTIYMVFDALESRALSLNDRLLVSEKAWRKGGSKMFIEAGDNVKVEDLIKGVIIQSGNDATIALAEGISGSEDAFAFKMTQKAKELGMQGSNFMNASGWPDPDHYSTAQDLALLAERMITDFPDYYRYYSIEDFTYNNITQRNRNPLLFRRDMDVDGIKTGHTEVGGYGLMASGQTPDKTRRVVLVMNGMDNEQARARETGEVMAWALDSFENVTLRSADEPVQDIPVIYGHRKSVAAVPAQDLMVTLPYLGRDQVNIEIISDQPLTAPVKKGQVIARMKITGPQMLPVERDLVAAENIKKSNLIFRFFESLGHRIFGSYEGGF